MPTNREPRVLLVDDEDQILQGLYLQLHREFEVTTARSGAEALEVLAKDQQFAVLVSDMRMPGMDGAELLLNARRTAPDTVRVLLTGHADIDAAASAVNEGEIFRFLTKPIEGNQLRNALHDAARKHNQLTAERELLEKTLRGTVEVLTNVLGIVNPEAFSCANRLHVIVQSICMNLQVQDSWRVEIAALLSQLGCVVLPPETSARAYANLPLTAQEQRDFQGTAKIASDLLANIPRLEPVSEMLERMSSTEAPPSGPLADCAAVTQGGEILRCATAFDRLSRTIGPHDALERMRETTHPQLLTALGELELPWMGPVAESVTLANLQPGMTLVRDARTSTGLLLAATGTKISEPLILLMQNSAQTDGVGLDEPLKVVFASHPESASAQGDVWTDPPFKED